MDLPRIHAEAGSTSNFSLSKHWQIDSLWEFSCHLSVFALPLWCDNIYPCDPLPNNLWLWLCALGQVNLCGFVELMAQAFCSSIRYLMEEWPAIWQLVMICDVYINTLRFEKVHYVSQVRFLWLKWCQYQRMVGLAHGLTCVSGLKLENPWVPQVNNCYIL